MPNVIIEEVLPQRTRRLSRSQRKAATSTAVIPYVAPSTIVAVPKRKKNRKKGRGKTNRMLKSQMTEKAFFAAHLMAPSLMGPFRQPRFGGSDRTGLAFDQTSTALIFNTSGAHCQFLQADSKYTNAALSVDVATTGTGLGVLNANAPGSQFPAATQIADLNLVACDIYAYYIGSPLNVAGEVIMGSCIPVISTTTRDSLYFYPGTVKFPVADLIGGVRRCFMRKLSAVADQFIPTGNLNADVDMPFIAVTGLPSDGNVRVVITRCFEYRSSTAPTLVVPYERVGPEFSSDLTAYQDARAVLANKPSTVDADFVGNIADSFLSMLGYGGGLGGVAALGLAGTYHAGRIAAGRRSRAFRMEDPAMSDVARGLAGMISSNAIEREL